MTMPIFDKKKNKNSDVNNQDAVNKPGRKKSGMTEKLSEQSNDYLSQARAILLEANISGASVRDAQDLFKRALQAEKDKDYDKSIDLAIECIELVDNIMKNE